MTKPARFTQSDERSREPAPIATRHPYFPTRCELCGWFGSSEQVHLSRNWDDADCVCPSCEQIFLCEEVEQTWPQSDERESDGN